EHDIEQDGDSISFQILTNSPTLGDGYNLRFDDFGKGEISSSENPISDWYVGYFIVDSLGNVVARRVGERNTIQPSIALGGWTATLDVSDLSLGNYTVYPFIADQTLAQDATDKTITVSPLPVVSPLALSIVEYGGFEWYATAERDSSLGSINITIYAHNKKQVAVILNNNKVEYYASPTAVKAEYAVKDITVNPNNAYAVIGRALITPSEYTSLAYVIVSLGGGRFVSDQIGVEEKNEGGGLLPTDESAE
ncbi:MAG: hypothetical protein J6U49_05000, partial [Alistipes sp.]|nr:hypothetical protein [Alistipes sp.]